MMFKKREVSITKKLVLSVATLVLAFMMLLLILNSVFLEEFYVFNLKDTFISEAEMIQDIYVNDEREVENLIKELNNTTGFKYNVVDADGKIYLSSVPEFDKSLLLSLPIHQSDYIRDNAKILENSYKYTIIEHPERKQDQVMLVVKLSENRYLVITEQLQEIRTNAAVANKFFVYSGMVILLLILPVTYLFSKRLVRPVLELNELTSHIADLKFDTYYKGPVEDEIGRLGKNLNRISRKLDAAIQDLEGKNEQLKNDINMQRYFLASVSHEFKTPVGIIKGYAESIKLNYYKTSEEKDEFTEYIIEESERLNDLVEDMIMLAKIDTRDFKLELRDMNLSDLVRNIYGKHSDSFSDINVSCEVNIERDIYTCVDEKRLKQVLENILTNARRYMDKNGSFSLELKQANDDVKLIIKNTCSDFSASDCDEIFRPFYRAEHSRSRITGGHGLGLSIVKAIIEAHDGSVYADYFGNTFELTITI